MISITEETKKNNANNKATPANERHNIKPTSYLFQETVRSVWIYITKYRSKSRKPNKYIVIKVEIIEFLKFLLISRHATRKIISTISRITI
jgi:hypothetical protein